MFPTEFLLVRSSVSKTFTMISQKTTLKYLPTLCCPDQSANSSNLQGLFNRIGPISTLALRFDRAGRSSGTAFVTYISLADARAAIREFDGANANGQPIRLTLLSAPGTSIDNVRGQGSGVERARNPFDTAVKPGRSLFERVEDPDDRRRYAMDKGRSRSRSRSPGAPRRTNTSKPPPEGVDRYVPSPSDRFDGSGRRRARTSRSHSPRWRAGARDDSRRRRPNGGGRERKTQEDLDKEMDDYFKEASGNKASAENSTNGVAIDSRLPTAAATNGDKDGDIDMIE